MYIYIYIERERERVAEIEIFNSLADCSRDYEDVFHCRRKSRRFVKPLFPFSQCAQIKTNKEKKINR